MSEWKMTVFYIGLGFFVFTMVVLPIIAFLLERKKYNSGIAPDGMRWIRFDVDSQGGRGYKDRSGNYCWISYPFIDGGSES